MVSVMEYIMKKMQRRQLTLVIIVSSVDLSQDSRDLVSEVIIFPFSTSIIVGGQWLSGRVLDSRPRGRGFEPHRRHFVVSLTKNINPSLVLVQTRKYRPFITERLLMGRKESKQTKTSIIVIILLPIS